MRGQKVAASKEAEFRKHYLATGNASASARAVNIPVNTGVDLAQRANADKKFVKAREKMYERALPDAERMLFAGMQIALERLNTDPLETVKKLVELEKPKGRGKAKVVGGPSKIHFQDAGAQYLRSMAASADVIAKIRRFDAERKGEVPSVASEVRIVVTTTEATANDVEQGD